MAYKITPIAYSIHRDTEHPLFGEDALHITAQDDAVGLYITLNIVCPSDTSETVFGQGKLSLDIEELKKVTEVANKLEEDWNEHEKNHK